MGAVPRDLPISTGSSTSVNVLSHRQQLAVTQEIENKILKQRRELLESGIGLTELKIRSLNFYHKGEQVNIENLSN